jgi:hypothetical protein
VYLPLPPHFFFVVILPQNNAALIARLGELRQKKHTLLDTIVEALPKLEKVLSSFSSLPCVLLLFSIGRADCVSALGNAVRMDRIRGEVLRRQHENMIRPPESQNILIFPLCILYTVTLNIGTFSSSSC